MVVRILLRNSLNVPNRLEMLHNEWKFLIFLSSEGFCSNWTHILLMDIVIMSRISDLVSSAVCLKCGISEAFRVLIKNNYPLFSCHQQTEAEPKVCSRFGFTHNAPAWHCYWRCNGQSDCFIRGTENCPLAHHDRAHEICKAANIDALSPSLCTCTQLCWVYVCQVGGGSLGWTRN